MLVRIFGAEDLIDRNVECQTFVVRVRVGVRVRVMIRVRVNQGRVRVQRTIPRK